MFTVSEQALGIKTNDLCFQPPLDNADFMSEFSERAKLAGEVATVDLMAALSP